ncbi:histidinol-phosphate transaminase [Enterobacteriaceae endosymbiont of Plateumaris braccata]|nr:histidinol-phosphate transaminase [Enterobacteriaceae endosymbiont of Plateumaris braccata]
MNFFKNIIYWDLCDTKKQKKILTRPVMFLDKKIQTEVTNIIHKVKQEGDSALEYYNLLFDNIKVQKLEIPIEKINNAKLNLKQDIKNAINSAYYNIHKFHSYQKYKTKRIETTSGVYCQEIFRPINSIGLYIPGGTAPLFSTVLMLGIPAQLALCKNIIMCTPAPISNEILYTANLCKIKKIFQIGGAQAIAAMAFGTNSIPKVNKIFGPGNSFVTEAKKQISYQKENIKNVSIDMPAGPSELMIIADKFAYSHFIVADLISQAEHGVDSQVILLTPEEKIAKEVINGINSQIINLPRKNIIQQSLSKSYIIITKDINQCIEISNKYSPEHLMIQCHKYEKILPNIINAGSIFLGNWAPESVGDYASGTNHVLPTYGYALTYSSLGVSDFQKRMTVQELTPQGLLNISNTVEIMSKTEKLIGHKNSVTLRSTFIKKKLLSEKNYKNNISKIVRKSILNFIPYQSARLLDNSRFDHILLNANESPITPVFKLIKNTFNRYPEPQPKRLIKNYSNYCGINITNILVSRGADEGIDLLIRAFCNHKNDKILFCPPTYGMYCISAKILGIKYNSVKSLENWQLDLYTIKKTLDNVKIIYICNPNNPTGNLINQNDIIELLEITQDKSIIVIDEAYIEFCINHTMVHLIEKYPNLVILRTLSKAFSLAGLRCGFVLANEEIINLLLKIIAPYPVPEPISDIAVQALNRKNLILMHNNVNKLMNNKIWLIKNLKKCHVVKNIFHSQTNYILTKFFNSNYIFKILSQKGIIVRNQDHQIGLSNCLRISVGTDYESTRLISILQELSSY